IDRSPPWWRAAFDFEPKWHNLYYNGFSNRSLWPVLHGLLTRARYVDDEWKAYVEVNELFADFASRLVAPEGLVWVHDYHLFRVGIGMRKRGFGGRLGFFLHVPFPSVDLFETIPWASELLEGLLSFDLVGFHTRRFVSNFIECAQTLVGA